MAEKLDFNAVKRKAERGQTNEEFFQWVAEEAKDYEQIAIVVHYPDGRINTFYSQENSLTLIGMLEVAKEQTLDSME